LEAHLGYRWLHNCFGTNARMTEMQAALGRAQLRKLGAWVEVRRAHAARLNACCRQFPALRVTQPPPDVYHSYYKYHVFVEPQHLREDWSRDRIMEAISAEGIPCRMIGGGGPQIQFEEAFGAHPQGGRPLPVAQALHDRGLSFLVHPTLTDEDLIDACHAVEKVLGAASI
jgi:dTDP-4-amino-4,6-dideoxygalactose transaminase